MADIATEAGISYGLLYHYFENKELVFQAAVERATTSGFQVLIKRIQALPLTPWECIYQFTEIVLDGILREPEGYLLSQQAIPIQMIERVNQKVAPSPTTLSTPTSPCCCLMSI